MSKCVTLEVVLELTNMFPLCDEQHFVENNDPNLMKIGIHGKVMQLFVKFCNGSMEGSCGFQSF